MFFRSGVLALPGLLLYICVSFSAFADDVFSLYARMGNIFVQDDKSARYQQSGLSLRQMNRDGSFHLDIAASRLWSDFPYADVKAHAVYYDVGLDTAYLGVSLKSGWFRHGYLDMTIRDKSFYNEGGEGTFVNPELAFHLGGFTLRPSFLYGTAQWLDGSFYWFYGKPDLPSLRMYGLEAVYDGHSFGMKYLSLDLDILNNDDIPLFEGRFYGFFPSYGFSRRYYNMWFTGTLGWLYAKGEAHGVLTAGNQGYWLFPFLFFNVDAAISAHIPWAMVKIRYDPGFFYCAATAGVLHIADGEAGVTAHYRQKNLFGGKERWEYPAPVNLTNSGLAFLVFDAGIKPGKHVAVGLEKVFAIPWGYKKIIEENSSGGTSASGDIPGGAALSFSSDSQMKWLRTALLSGLSVYVKAGF